MKGELCQDCVEAQKTSVRVVQLGYKHQWQIGDPILCEKRGTFSLSVRSLENHDGHVAAICQEYGAR